MIPEKVRDWLAEQGHGQITGWRGVGGGCINNGMRLTTTSGHSFFLKTNRSAPPDMFAQEAAGLLALDVPDGPRVPRPFLHGPDFFLMEDLTPARPAKDYWQKFGRQMAALHNHTSPKFGSDEDNYIGRTPQPNDWMEDGYQFFARRRLNFQAEMAAKNGLLEFQEVAKISAIASRLRELVPEQPASILHGDLWSGNSMTDAKGQPAIIDPAAYYGWAEADLAMMTLFGSPGAGFWDAYNEVRPLEPGWRERFSLYNLYHLLNHLNLFGRGYYAQVMSTAQQFAS